MLLFENMLLFLSWEWMYNWHPEYPAHVAEPECFPRDSATLRLVSRASTTIRSSILDCLTVAIHCWVDVDLPMPSSGYTLFFVTLRPGFEPRENIHILTRGQGIQGASCTSIPNSKTTVLKQQHMIIIPNSKTTCSQTATDDYLFFCVSMIGSVCPWTYSSGGPIKTLVCCCVSSSPQSATWVNTFFGCV